MLTGFASSSYHYSVELLMIKNGFVHLPSRKPRRICTVIFFSPVSSQNQIPAWFHWLVFDCTEPTSRVSRLAQMLRELWHLSIIWGISEDLLLRLSFSYVKQEFSWVGTGDWKWKGRQQDREQRGTEICAASRHHKNKGLFRLTGDTVSSVSGMLLVLTCSEATLYVWGDSEELRGIKEI